MRVVALPMSETEAEAVMHALALAVELIDQVDPPPEAPLHGKSHLLEAVSRRLDHAARWVAPEEVQSDADGLTTWKVPGAYAEALVRASSAERAAQIAHDEDPYVTAGTDANRRFDGSPALVTHAPISDGEGILHAFAE